MNENKNEVVLAVHEKMFAAVTGAFGLVVGLAWNDAVKSLIESIYPVGSGILPKFIYAVIVTVFVSLLIYFVSKWLAPKKPKE